MNAQPVYLIDTSYLLELYAVPGHSTQKAVDEIRSRFTDAARQDARLYVTVPSIYELANHIAHISDGNVRFSFLIFHERVSVEKKKELQHRQKGAQWHLRNAWLSRMYRRDRRA